MDPLGTIQFVLGAIDYLKTATDKVKENKYECRRLCSHVGSLLDLVQTEFKSGIPDTIQHRLSKLANTLLDLSAAVDELSDGSLLMRTINRSAISAQIQKAYRDISDGVQELNLGLQVELRRFQQENEDARRKDARKAENRFQRILQNGEDVLQTLQIQKRQMQEVMLCIHQHLMHLPQSVERQLLEGGLFRLQRRSGPMKTVLDEFVITSFDVIIFRDRKLGEGGFATVYEADWKGTKVAVKELEKGAPASVVQHEINIWKRLRHPHILQFLGACTISEPSFLVCSLKLNGDITSYLLKNPGADRSKLLHEASLGLTYLHDNDVVHGDLKGTNILVDEHGTACIADFGLSKIKNFSTTIRRPVHVSEQVGTLRYMSPESMTSGVNDKKSDVYSFGMTMYEVYSGKPPFSGIQDFLLLSIVSDRGHRPLQLDDTSRHTVGLSEEIWLIIVDSWSQDPEERPSAAEISDRMANIIVATKQLETITRHDILDLQPPRLAYNASSTSDPYDCGNFNNPQPGSTLALNDMSPPQGIPLVTRRYGYWNRRGDHLVIIPRPNYATSIGDLKDRHYIVYVPREQANPDDLAGYPGPTLGWMDHRGRTIEYDPTVPELPESIPRPGEPATRPYQSFVQYITV